MKIKKNDTVLILKGKDRGKTGKITKVLPKVGKVIVAGLNVSKKHSRVSRKNPRGGIIDIHRPISSANVVVICPRCSKITKVEYKITDKGKMRICKKCHEAVDQ